MTRSSWTPRWGDINGLFGLLLDNVAALVLMYTLLTSLGYRSDRFAPSFVLIWMIPGTVIGVLVGGLLYSASAQMLARRTGRHDVTAMPVGLDTPSVFGLSLFVLIPALTEGHERFAPLHQSERELHHLASVYAWHVGASVLVMIGVFKMVLSPLGHLVRRLVPRAALLGSLAAVALALIAFVPLARHVAPAPVVGLPVLAIILVTLMTRRGTHDAVPGTVVALVVGIAIVFLSAVLGDWRGWSFIPLPESSLRRAVSTPPLPAEMWSASWWSAVWWSALTKLPLALPFAVFTLVGGVECAESAAAAGDDYDPRGVLLIQGVASTVAGLLGGVVQTTPYFGHPAYKKMGSGRAYAAVATLALAVIACSGGFTRVLEYIPGAVLFPVIVYIGLRTIAHSFESTPSRDYAAMALAAVPVLAYLILVSVDELLGGAQPPRSSAVLLQALRCLGNGFILTSLLWAAALTMIMDGRSVRAALVLLVAAVCALFGLIHSPLPGGPLAWPHDVWAKLGTHPDSPLRYQSPFHWAAGYVLAAVVLIVDSLIPMRTAPRKEAVPTSTPAATSDGVTQPVGEGASMAVQ
jgi:AGZA family xanthine/uracil permease-like MFS transporter